MSILAKKEGFFRVLGTIIILIGLILSLILDFFIFNSALYYFIIIITLIPVIFLVICFKLEWSIIRNNTSAFFLILVFYLSLMIIISTLISPNDSYILPFVIIILSNILFLLCWHFSFSIYKKEKKLFIITGSGYILISIFYKLGSLITQLGFYISIIPVFLLIIGMCLIIIVETRMKKKGLLNYI